MDALFTGLVLLATRALILTRPLNPSGEGPVKKQFDDTARLIMDRAACDVLVFGA